MRVRVCGRARVCEWVEQPSLATTAPLTLLPSSPPPATLYPPQASAQQRRGRAGRVRPGLCFRLFSRLQWSKMEAHTAPEMLRSPLESVCLTIRCVCVKGGGGGEGLLGGHVRARAAAFAAAVAVWGRQVHAAPPCLVPTHGQRCCGHSAGAACCAGPCCARVGPAGGACGSCFGCACEPSRRLLLLHAPCAGP